MNVYCGGRFVPLVQAGAWLRCTGCGRDVWEVGAKFVVDASGIQSGHGSEEDSTVEGHRVLTQKDGSVAGGAVQAGDA